MKKLKPHILPALGIISLLALLFAFFVPLPYYLELPGSADDVRDVVTVDGKADTASGSYNFVTVSVTPATAAQLLYAALTPFTDIYTEEEMTGGSSSEEFVRINQFYMETSQNMAKYQALTLAGKPTTLDFLGVYVLQVTDDSSFKGVLNIADTVTDVNGQTFESSKALIEYVSSLTLGDDVEVSYTEDGQSLTATGKIIKLENGKNGIGIGLVDHTEVTSDTSIDFHTENIGGPSAGLMFTLAIYTQLADPDLRDGRTIAGTGTIEEDGSVGDVGGIDKKVVAADRAGASLFLVPDNPVEEEVLKKDPEAQSNYQEALEAAKIIDTDMVIVPVSKIQDAIDYLKNK